jgi:hypothetical protein
MWKYNSIHTNPKMQTIRERRAAQLLKSDAKIVAVAEVASSGPAGEQPSKQELGHFSVVRHGRSTALLAQQNARKLAYSESWRCPLQRD